MDYKNSNQPNEVSSALSKLEVRIVGLLGVQTEMGRVVSKICQNRSEIETLEFKLAELQANEEFNYSRIEDLKNEAREEGFSDEYLDRFVKERGFRDRN